MLVAMGGVNCKFVFFGSEPFFFLASSFCHEFPGNPGHLLINVEILNFSGQSWECLHFLTTNDWNG